MRCSLVSTGFGAEAAPVVCRALAAALTKIACGPAGAAVAGLVSAAAELVCAMER
jgi:hypothetical protein